MVLPVITLYQPWATWIIRGWKTIETRTHDRFACLKNRKILIHSGLTTDGSDLTVKNKYLTLDQKLYKPDEVVNGYILGSAFVYDFKALSAIHSRDALIECETTKRFGLFLKDIEMFENPIKEKGQMGIWYFDMDKKSKHSTPAPATLF